MGRIAHTKDVVRGIEESSDGAGGELLRVHNHSETCWMVEVMEVRGRCVHVSRN